MSNTREQYLAKLELMTKALINDPVKSKRLLADIEKVKNGVDPFKKEVSRRV